MAEWWRGWFRGKPQRHDTTPKSDVLVLTDLERVDGDEIVCVVGESHYQEAIRKACGSDRWEDVRCEIEALLVREPDNPHDPNAIRVEVGGNTVGYLARGDALDYGPLIERLHKDGKAGVCGGMIAGRGPGSETSNLGVFLHIRPPSK